MPDIIQGLPDRARPGRGPRFRSRGPRGAQASGRGGRITAASLARPRGLLGGPLRSPGPPGETPAGKS
eukprot:2479321-Pyramimonas_sp.AAC.1